LFDAGNERRLGARRRADGSAMKRYLAMTLGVVTAIGGFLDIGEFVSLPQAGATFGLALLPVVVIGTIGAPARRSSASEALRSASLLEPALVPGADTGGLRRFGDLEAEADLGCAGGQGDQPAHARCDPSEFELISGAAGVPCEVDRVAHAGGLTRPCGATADGGDVEA
jgi:hypothetical protein